MLFIQLPVETASLVVIIIVIITMALSFSKRIPSYWTIILGLLAAYIVFAILNNNHPTEIIYNLGTNTDNIQNGSEPWRLFTSTFIHVDVFHLLFNLLFLLIFGRSLTISIGSRNFALLFFLGAALTSFVASFLYPSGVIFIGASGGVSMIAGILLTIPYVRTVIFDNASSPRLYMRLLIITWIVVEMIMMTNSRDAGTIAYLVQMVGVVIGMTIGLLSTTLRLSPIDEAERSDICVIDIETLGRTSQKKELRDNQYAISRVLHSKTFDDQSSLIEDICCPICHGRTVIRGDCFVCKKGHAIKVNKSTRHRLTDTIW